MLTIEFKGKEYTLTEDAYINQSNDKVFYQAVATDNNGNEYLVKWDVVENWNEIEDASEHCDWYEPVEVEKF